MHPIAGMLVPVLAAVLIAAPVYANGSSVSPVSPAKRIGKVMISSYDKTHKCWVVCKGSKPFLEYVADGLAYALDIPLAILSPVTCPIVAPVLRRIDSDGDRVYYSGRKARR
jgi:hypothetical protein